MTPGGKVQRQPKRKSPHCCVCSDWPTIGSGCWRRSASTSLTEIAEAEGIDLAQASKIIRLTQLAPDLVEGIVNGRIKAGANQLLRGKLYASWPAQRKALSGGSGARIT